MVKTTLLISRDPGLVKKAKAVVSSIANCQLQPLADRNVAMARVHQEDVRVALVHLAAGERERTLGFVRELRSTGRPVPILVVSDAYQDREAVAVLRAGAVDYDEVSHGLCKLPHFLELVDLSLSIQAPCHECNGKSSLGSCAE